MVNYISSRRTRATGGWDAVFAVNTVGRHGALDGVASEDKWTLF